MGLPFELWDHVVGFLESDPYALLSCCLTCRCFYKHAEDRLERLLCPTMSLNNLTAFNQFVEEVRTIPGRARSIVNLRLEDSPPLAFSFVPLRLASQLVNLRTLTLRSIHRAPDVPSSTWSLYGRALPRVVHLYLYFFRFPSFMDFVRFITSFRSLEILDLLFLSCAHQGVLPSILWSPHKLNALERLDLSSSDEDGGHFFRQFVHWFSSKGGVVKHLSLSSTVLSHPSGSLLLESVQGHLQQLSLDLRGSPPTEEFRTVWQRFISE